MIDMSTALWALGLGSSLLALAYVGYHLLWRVPLNDGSLKAIVAVKRGKRFPNGNVLDTRYTGYKRLDDLLLTPVVFYEGLLDGSSLPYLLMLLDVHASMQTTATVMLVRLKVVHAMPTYLAALMLAGWGTFNQFYGAAFVYPVYCFMELLLDVVGGKVPAAQTVVPTEVASAVCIASVIGFAFPLVFASPAFLGLSRPLRQKIVAYYRLGPIAFAAVYAMAEQVAAYWVSKGPTGSTHPGWIVVLALDAATVYAGLGHAAAFAIPLFQPRSLHVLAQVFLPRSSHIRPTSQKMIQDAAHRFLQYDLYVIAATFIVWAVWICKDFAPEESGFMRLVGGILGAVAMGPGAVVAQAAKLNLQAYS